MKFNKDTIVCISIASEPGNFGMKFHNSAYKLLNLNWIYISRKIVDQKDLEKVINGIRIFDIKGCSVSMPFKESVINFLDDVEENAIIIGAVNTIVQEENRILKGYNTDYYGAKKALEKISIKGKEVLLIGAGGAAKAVCCAVKELGGILSITNRTFSKSIELCKKLDVNIIPWDNLKDSSAYLLINATSVGMNNYSEMIVKEKCLDNFDAVMDVVIYPAETKLLKIAKEKGKEVISGKLMCVYQAAKQFEIYTGYKAPKELLERTINSIT